MPTKQEIADEISQMFNENQLEDLKRFLSKRKCLNFSNNILVYIFHAVQTSGILLTTIAAGYKVEALVWVGAGVSALASLIKIYESQNNTMLKKLMVDIQKIRDGTYVDEGSLVDSEGAQPQQAPPPAHAPETPIQVVVQDVVPTYPAATGKKPANVLASATVELNEHEH
jgi:hypothetical protein